MTYKMLFAFAVLLFLSPLPYGRATLPYHNTNTAAIETIAYPAAFDHSPKLKKPGLRQQIRSFRAARK